MFCSFVRNLHTKQHISNINWFFIFHTGFSQVLVETSQQEIFTLLLSNVQNGCAYTLWHVFGHSFLKIASYYIIFVSPFLLWAQILWFIYLLYKKGCTSYFCYFCHLIIRMIIYMIDRLAFKSALKFNPKRLSGKFVIFWIWKSTNFLYLYSRL